MENDLKNNTQKYEQLYNVYQRKYHQITVLRFLLLAVIIGCIYFGVRDSNLYLLIPAIVCVVIFIFLLKIDSNLIAQKKKYKLLQQINKNELAFLTYHKSNYANGNEFNDYAHLYTKDIDIFGESSLFQYINRTGTIMGHNQLAASFLKKQNLEEIKLVQEAVKECSTKPDFRQELLALGILANDSKEKYKKIKEWSSTHFKPIPSFLKIALFVLPVILLTVIIIDNTTAIPNLHWVAIFLFGVNVYITSRYGKQLLNIINSTEKVNESISNYGKIIKLIENTSFTSHKMQALKTSLTDKEIVVSKELDKLAVIIANIESVQNVFGAMIVNGFTFFHIHQLNALNEWKAKFNQSIENWLAVIGEVEKINSFSNFAANNPSYCYPNLNNEIKFEFEHLGHPLIPKAKRVSNSLTIENGKLIVLSGSNMSGKSTFLRTIGINMVLANAGSPICATNATLAHLELACCMRLSDSLEENESYFFAEVKRLQQIIELCKKENCFVLLDEILRGTNSDDKKQGTIKVIQQLLHLRASGIIATHDIEVCNWGDINSSDISLYCFENEIRNNELYFDYQLRKGICKNKTASFLLKKMNVIE